VFTEARATNRLEEDNNAQRARRDRDTEARATNCHEEDSNAHRARRDHDTEARATSLLKKTAMRNVPGVIVTLKQGRPIVLKNLMTYAEVDFIKTMKQQKKQEGWHAKMYKRYAA
jgi:hypothetical protein